MRCVAQPAPAQTPAIGQQAVSVVLKHYEVNPLVIDGKTGHALPNTGEWSVAKTPPAACAQTTERCVEVFYQVAAEDVRCSWTLLVNADGTDGTFLEENGDAEVYLLRRVSGSEAQELVVTRKRPIYPPLASAAHVSGTVKIMAIVSKSGTVDKIASVSGPGMVAGAASDAAMRWVFKPLMVGVNAVPYVITLEFTFNSGGPETRGGIQMTP